MTLGASTSRRSSAKTRSPAASATRGAAARVSRSVSGSGAEAELGDEAGEPQRPQRIRS